MKANPPTTDSLFSTDLLGSFKSASPPTSFPPSTVLAKSPTPRHQGTSGDAPIVLDGDDDVVMSPAGGADPHGSEDQELGKQASVLPKDKSAQPKPLTEFEQAFEQEDLDRETRFQEALEAGDATATTIEAILHKMVGDRIQFGQLGCTLYRRDITTIAPGIWLTDEMLMTYLRSRLPDDTFYVMRPTAVPFHVAMWKANPTATAAESARIPWTATTILIPLNIPDLHWSLAVADVGTRVVTVYDSTTEILPSSMVVAEQAISVLKGAGAAWGHPAQSPEIPDWTVAVGSSAQQRNADDCGLYVLANGIATIKKMAAPSTKGLRRKVASKILRLMDNSVDSSEDDSASENESASEEEPFPNLDPNGDYDYTDSFASSYLTNYSMHEKHATQAACAICGRVYPDMKTHLHNDHALEGFLCTWPGCYHILKDEVGREDHIKIVHEMMVWICIVPSCLERYSDPDAALNHWTESHETCPDRPKQAIPPAARNWSTMAYVQTYAESCRQSLYGEVTEKYELAQRRALYDLYDDGKVEDKATSEGVLFQDPNALSHCRTWDYKYELQVRREGAEARNDFKWEIGRVRKPTGWWIQFLHKPKGPLLDKFIEDTLLGWCEVSHQCHFWPCQVLGHLEYVPKYINADRDKCTRNPRKRWGICQAFSSFHSHDPCHIDPPRGEDFGEQQQPVSRKRGPEKQKPEPKERGPKKQKPGKGSRKNLEELTDAMLLAAAQPDSGPEGLLRLLRTLEGGEAYRNLTLQLSRLYPKWWMENTKYLRLKDNDVKEVISQLGRTHKLIVGLLKRKSI